MNLLRFIPYGLFIDSLLVALAGFLGGFLGKRLSSTLCEALRQMMGFVALGIAVTLTVKVNTLAAVVLAVLIGTLIGTLLKLDDGVSNYFEKLNRRFSKGNPDEDYMAQFTTLLVLSCASGTGIFGAMQEGLTGDITIMICKAILDFFTVLVFASTLGKFCSIISIPQFIIYFIIFLCTSLISPLMTDVLKADFTAVGGIIELIVGLRILKLTKVKAIDALPALILIFPISYLWNIIF